VGDLAEGLNISYPSATNMVHRLEKKALIRRVANPRDRRQVGLALTDAGREIIQRVDQERRQRFASVLAQMEPAERSAFIEGLSAFIRAGVEAGILKPMEVCLQCGASADPNCPLVEMHAVEECR
jgi:DNA-binding MarR family transcriptional regulator